MVLSRRAKAKNLEDKRVSARGIFGIKVLRCVACGLIG